MAGFRSPEPEMRALDILRRPALDGAAYCAQSELALECEPSDRGGRVTRAGAQVATDRALHGAAGANDEKRSANVIGRYVIKPAHTAVLWIHKETAIHALDGKGPALLLSPDRRATRGCERSHGRLLSRYAAFNRKPRELLGKIAARYRSAGVAFLAAIDVGPAARRRGLRD